VPRRLPDELDVFLLLHLATSAVWPLLQREFEVEGVNPSHWGLLVHVGARGRMTPSELAAETGVGATTMRDQLQALVDRGALERVENADDARSYFVTLTPQGRRELERGRAASRRTLAELDELHGSLGALRAELERLVYAADAADGR
jgi:DNA-binding MarR family transcriptional regulator